MLTEESKQAYVGIIKAKFPCIIESIGPSQIKEIGKYTLNSVPNKSPTTLETVLLTPIELPLLKEFVLNAPIKKLAINDMATRIPVTIRTPSWPPVMLLSLIAIV
jgi:hypothetical protein